MMIGTELAVCHRGCLDEHAQLRGSLSIIAGFSRRSVYEILATGRRSIARSI